MKRLTLLVIGLGGLGLGGLGLGGLGEAEARAQVGVVTYYQPTTVYQPVPAPAYSAPAYPAAYPVRGGFYSSYYAPPPVPVYQPVTRVRTRYRPFLGGTVTRVRHGVAPAYYNPPPLIYAY